MELPQPIARTFGIGEPRAVPGAGAASYVARPRRAAFAGSPFEQAVSFTKGG